MTSPATTFEHYGDSFSKLSKLREDVLAGAHPRIKLPWAAIQQLKPADGISEESAFVPKPPPGVAAPQGNDLPAPAPSASSDAPAAQHQPNGLSVPSQTPQHASPSHVNEQSVPQFLPFLLEKSPALVQAEERSKRQREEQEGQRHSQELRNKRQRLEKALKAEFNKHIPEEKVKYELKNWDAPCNVDVAQLHDAALAATKSGSTGPAAADHADAPASSHSSFDENSYYSSQVNEHWTSGSEEGEVQSEVDATNAAHLGDGAHASPNDSGSKRRQQGAGFENDVTAASAKPPNRLPLHADGSGRPGSNRRKARGGQEGRDESYSPPSPGAFRKDDPANRLQDVVPRGPRAMQPAPRPQQKKPARQESEAYSPPSPAFPIVRNHINAPVAPQPSRVSPLTGHYQSGHQQPQWTGQDAYAQPGPSQPYGQRGNKRSQQQQQGRNVTKQSNNQQQRKHPQDRGRSGRQVPYDDMTQSNGLSRKRPRGDDLDELHYTHQAPPPPKRQQLPLPRETVPSPLPYIKPEPVSPPPLDALPVDNPPRRAVPRRLNVGEDDPQSYELVSPRGPELSRPQSARQPVYSSEPIVTSSRVSDRYGVNRIPSSPIMVRRPAGDEHNLRRVASLQNASQYSARREHAPLYTHELQDARLSRAPSRQQFVEDDVEYVPVSRHHAPTRYASPGPRMGEYPPSLFEARQTMPSPAKKRIIVLENGEEWIAVPNTVESRQSLAPEPRRTDYQAQYVEPPNGLQSQHRGPSHAVHRPRREVIQIDDDDDTYQRMPPPPPPPPPPMARPRYVDDQLQRALSYQPTVRPRAVSIQPFPSPSDPRYGQMPLPRSYEHTDRQYLPDRAYSTRPNTMQQGAMYDGQAHYGMM